MTWLQMVPAQYRVLATVALAAVLLTAAAGVGWLVQGWRMGVQLAEQGRELDRQIADRDQLHADTLAEISRAASAQVQREQEKRLQLEQDLAASSTEQQGKLTDAEKNAARLRDRLATANLRLSVLLASPATSGAGGNRVPAATGTGCLVDGAGRADIDPGAAQRIVSIADRGDRAIIALTACQAYVRKVSGS